MIILVTAGMFPNACVKDDTECRAFSEEPHGTKRTNNMLLFTCCMIFLSSLIGETKTSVCGLQQGPGEWGKEGSIYLCNFQNWSMAQSEQLKYLQSKQCWL